MMNAEQKQAARNLIDDFKDAGNEWDEAAVASHMTALLKELVDADDKFKIGVLAAINAAAPDARHVEVDGQPVFFSKSGDDITDTHTLAPCPHCGGSGAAEDCAPEPEPFGYFKSEPFGWTDCAETDDGAIALYAAPPAPSVHVSPMENIALDEWLDKTEWVQKEINTFPVSSLGMHRADVMRIEIERLREMLAAPPAPSVPDGWRIVPYTPTVQMLERAAYAVNNRPQPSKYEPSATPAIILWTAMLNYAPEAVFINSCSKPPKLSDERIKELLGEVPDGPDDLVIRIARAVEREILGGDEK